MRHTDQRGKGGRLYGTFCNSSAEVKSNRPAGIAPFEEVAGEVQKTLTDLLEQRAMGAMRHVREITLDPFYLRAYAITNAGFNCSAISPVMGRRRSERAGPLSSKTTSHLNAEAPPSRPRPGGFAWMQRVGGIRKVPEAPPLRRADHPLVHISWNNARAYCECAGYRLPTQAEWEVAARGGLERKSYPWCDIPLPDGLHRCNNWRRSFASRPRRRWFYAASAGLRIPRKWLRYFNAVGNGWEWCANRFVRDALSWNTRVNPAGPPNGSGRVIKGGSYLCHQS